MCDIHFVQPFISCNDTKENLSFNFVSILLDLQPLLFHPYYFSLEFICRYAVLAWMEGRGLRNSTWIQMAHVNCCWNNFHFTSNWYKCFGWMWIHFSTQRNSMFLTNYFSTMSIYSCKKFHRASCFTSATFLSLPSPVVDFHYYRFRAAF